MRRDERGGRPTPVMKRCLVILCVGFASALHAGSVSDSRGRPVDAAALNSMPGESATVPAVLPETLAAEAPVVELLKRHLPPLASPRDGRWPLLCWTPAPASAALADAFIERGISPLFNGVSTPGQAARYAPVLRHFRDRGVPLIILPQGVLQRAYREPPAGLGCDHLSPARPRRAVGERTESDNDFTCPAWMYINPALRTHRDNTLALCRRLKEEGIEPASMWLDFESGAYLRNGADEAGRVQAAMTEAARCPRCVGRFGKAALVSPASYSRLVDAARAEVIRTGFVEPVHAVFPSCATGNFYAWPVGRAPVQPDRHPAYGYEGSGMNVPQPRTYFTPGWGGAGADQPKTDWNIFYYAVSEFSRVARVRREGEILVPWIGYVWNNPGSLAKAKRKAPIASAAAYREMAIHLLMRGAETIAVFTPDAVDGSLPAAYAGLPRGELGPFLLNVMDVQAGYRDVLRWQKLLRAGKPLNLDLAGTYNAPADDGVWSGVGSADRALVRTVSFGREGDREVTIHNRPVRLPFRRQGRFMLVHPDGRVEPVDEAAGPDRR